jgi:RNA 3'-phosphate cyclase
MITLDGAEGGGQMLRTALALSALTSQPFKMINIRASRPQPGLKPQHYTCVKALQELTKAKTDVQLGSEELMFIPEKYKAQSQVIDIGTAGSITLLLQSILLPAMFSSRTHTLTIKGGTDTKWSMPIDYFANVILPQFRRYAGFELKILKRGYYPKGGGEVELKIVPRFKLNKYTSLKELCDQMKPIDITETGKLMVIKGVSHASKDLENSQVAERQAYAAKQLLGEVPVDIAVQYNETLSTGSNIVLWAMYSKQGDEIDFSNPVIVGADALGERGKRAEQVGQDAAEKLRRLLNDKIPVDEHLADNLIPLMGMARGSEIKTTEITQHMRTNIKVVESFFGECFKIRDNIIETYK